jgi:hypothetical protein
MKMKIIYVTISVVLLYLFAGVITVEASKSDNKKPIIVGANLDKYKPPHNVRCDINVPEQYSTIQAAIDAAIPGDTVCVGEGVYNENLRILKAIRLSGRGYDKTIINGIAPPAIGGDAYAVSVSYSNFQSLVDGVVIEGFRINGVSGDIYDTAALLIWPNSINTIIRYNLISSGDYGFALIAGGNFDLLENNVFIGNLSKDIVVTGQTILDLRVLNNAFIGTINPNAGDNFGRVLDFWSYNGEIKWNSFNVVSGLKSVVSLSRPGQIVNENNINGLYALDYWKLVGTSTNAENNWWGEASSPQSYIYGDADFEPYNTVPYSEHPIPILN